jgi:hypothetical protein
MRLRARRYDGCYVTLLISKWSTALAAEASVNALAAAAARAETPILDGQRLIAKICGG